MMRIDILSVVPSLLESPFNDSILLRAQKKGLVDFHVHNIRDYSELNQKSVDDYQYGGGAGMVLRPEPIAKAIDQLSSKRKYDAIIYTTPDGELFNQSMANSFSLLKNIILLCGHYKGVDQRIRELYITHEISIGNYVLSGGELPAAIISDAIIRLIPGVLNDASSALSDSFQDNLLAPPVYTRPQVFKGLKVPEVLLSGHQKNISDWRLQKAEQQTKKRRPDLLK